MKKGAIYARYSSDKQSGESVKVQIDKCREYCEMRRSKKHIPLSFWP